MIYEVFIEKVNRNRGLGKVLLNKMIDECKGNGYKVIRLMVNADNVSALKLYRSIGFVDRRIEMTYEIS